MAKIDISDVDRDFLGLARPIPQPMHVSSQNGPPVTIHIDGL
jgi:hypothetical protein